MSVTKPEKRILITGGAGFIGSHVVRHFVRSYPNYEVVNADLLTYAGNLENLSDIEREPNYDFVRADITDLPAMQQLFHAMEITDVIHLAAE
ncbi:MAG TPA: GDP-mannose 4,6-dehydratase, partial [Saprospiraceae bacterium]|nr:GDP-mannose 4,6-dehydratase [Saprospiraceae bacterium]